VPTLLAAIAAEQNVDPLGTQLPAVRTTEDYLSRTGKGCAGKQKS
jgi:hypothetical protein